MLVFPKPIKDDMMTMPVGEETRIDRDAVLIGDAAAELGISESTLRLYDTHGIVVFPRDRRRYRWVGLREIERVRAIRAYMQANRLNLVSLVTLAAYIPCWVVNQCGSEAQQTCSYRQRGKRPCWSYHREDGGCLEQRCSDCTVYRDLCHWLDRLRTTYLTESTEVQALR